MATNTDTYNNNKHQNPTPSNYSESGANTGATSIRPTDREYIDVDPLLKGFKEGMPMQRTYFNTKLGGLGRLAGAVTERSLQGSAADAESSYPSKRNRVGGTFVTSRMSGPACNYQNVDLFKIPENDLRKKFSKRSRSPKSAWNKGKLSAMGKSFATI